MTYILKYTILKSTPKIKSMTTIGCSRNISQKANYTQEWSATKSTTTNGEEQKPPPPKKLKPSHHLLLFIVYTPRRTKNKAFPTRLS